MNQRDLKADYTGFEKLHSAEEWEVYSACDKDKGLKWIIKLSSDHSFEKEAKLLSHLNHSFWASIADWGQDKETKKYYLIREFKEGKTLSEISTLNQLEVQKITVQIARVLFYLHQKRLAYLDLKPDNIIWDGQEVALIDSSLVSPFEYTLRKIPRGGTPAYMAPECFIGGALFHQADLYSLGILLYEMVAGRLPFQAREIKDLISQHLFVTPQHPSLIARDCPRPLGDLILRLLQKNPADRFEDANDLIRWINRLFDTKRPLEPQLKRITKADEKRFRETNPLIFVDKMISYVESLDKKSEKDWEQLGSLYLQKDNEEKIGSVIPKLSPLKGAILSARLLIKKGQFKEAEHSLESDVVDENKLSSEDAAVFYNIKGRIFYYLGNRDQSRKSFSKACEFFRKTGDEEGVINALNNGGNAAVGLGDEKGAKRIYEEVLRCSQKIKNPILEGRSYSNLGFLAFHQNDYQKAFENYKKSYEMNDLMGKRLEKIQAGLNLGEIYTFFGSWLKAEEILEIAYQESRHIKNFYMMALCRLHQVDLKLSTGQSSEGKNLLEKCFSFIGTSSNPIDLFHIYLTAGEVYLNLKNYNKAQDYLEKAKRELERGSLTRFKARYQWLQLVRKAAKENLGLSELIPCLKKLYESKDENYLLKAFSWIFEQFNESELTEGGLVKFLEENKEKILKRIPPEHRESFQNRIFPKKENVMKDSPDTSFMERFMELNSELTSELNINRLLEKIMDVLIEVTGAERGFILLLQDDELKKVFSKNYESGRVKSAEEQISQSLSRKVFEENRAVVTIDAMADRRFAHTTSIHKLKLRSIICLPFSFRGKVLGVVYLDNRLHKTFFEKEQIHHLEPFANQIAIAIHNARIFEEKNQKIDNLTQKLNQTQKEVSLKYSYSNLVGRHSKMINLFRLLDKVTDSPVPVFIHGESGVGKEMVAKAIHYNGKRAKGSFVSINCASVPETLLEAELFGAVKGAYTGSTEDRPGLFVLAHGGSLFLDEIGDMPPSMQAKLLRVLQDGEVRPVGGKKTHKVDIRLISASNKNLKELVKEGKFREDLYYRLYVAPLDVPPLREKKDDIPLLVNHFLKLYSEKNNLPKKKISKEALKLFINYSWPGNVRELENFVYQLCVFSEGSTINVQDLRIKEEFFEQAEKTEGHALSQKIDSGKLSLSKAKQEFEKNEVIRALNLYHGHITKAAKHLKMVRPQLSRLIKYYGIKPSTF